MFDKIWRKLTESKKNGKTISESVAQTKPKSAAKASANLASAYRKLAQKNTPKPQIQPAAPIETQSRQRQLPYSQWRQLMQSLFAGRKLEETRIDGSLILSRLCLRYLPDNLSVQGDLDLRQCQRLQKLGRNLQVTASLYIGGKAPKPPWWEQWQKDVAVSGEADHLSRDRHCPLPALPAGMVIGKNLQIHNCDWLSQIPDDLHLGESLIIVGCRRLKQLPDPLEIKGNLILSGLKSLQALPQNIHVHQNMILMGGAIAELPAGLRIDGDLHIQSCLRLRSLPQRLKLAGSLIINRCLFLRLPEAMQIGADLCISRCPHLVETPAELSVSGNVTIAQCNSLAKVTSGIQIGGNLNLLHCKRLTSLPDNLAVPGAINLTGCSSLAQLPADLNLGNHYLALNLSGCTALRHLPENIKGNGGIELYNSGLESLPDRLVRQVTLRWRGVAVESDLIFNPETLPPEQILGQRNSELRRVLLERVGIDKVLAEAGAKELDSDTDCGGPRKLVVVKLPTLSRENLVYLVCRCPSSGRQYMLRVPPNTQNCHEAAAWIAGFENPDEYRPYQET